jgi:SMC interacting uncharacterized protein involved in chromosome segregation
MAVEFSQNKMEKSQSDIEFEAEMEALDRMFPDANFSICIGLSDLDDVISHDNVIVIRITHKCYCYMNNPRKDDLIYVYNKTGNGITNKDVVDAMIEDGYDPDCSHVFYEGLRQVRAGVFKAHFGS